MVSEKEIMPDMQPTFMTGEICFLRGLTLQDATEDYLRWLNDFEVTRYLEVGRVPMTLDNLREYIIGGMTDSSTVRFTICDKATHKHIGNITLRHIHPIHRRADLGILIGEKDFWGKGYATEATALVVDYGFRRLNLHSIWLGVLADHTAAIRAYEKVGFKLDGTDRESWWADGQFHDVHRMSILARDYFARAKE
jgi:[ribosomal protein S5]-alanine N-acetyltransferase